MKASIKLLVGIFFVILIAMVGTGWSFRQQYDKLDHSDPYAQFSRQKLPAFRALKIVSTPNQQFLIVPGSTPMLRVKTEYQTGVTYQTLGDTLLIRYIPAIQNEDTPWTGTIAVLSAPNLQTVHIENAHCKVAGWQLPTLTLAQTGRNGVVELENTLIGNFQATMHGKSLLALDDKSAISQAKVNVRDSARFTVGKAQIGSLQLQADSATSVQVPGALLAKIK